MVQPAPDGTSTDRSHKPGLASLTRQIIATPSRQRQIVGRRKFASPSLNLNDEVWGKKSGDGPDAPALPILGGDRRRTVSATDRQPHGGCRGARQSRRWSIPRRPRGSSWLAGPENTITYICRLASATRPLRQTTSESEKGLFLACGNTLPSRCHNAALNSRRIIRDCIYEMTD